MSAPVARGYETLYGVGLLDDLHNYFPAVLYDSGRFTSVHELLRYIQISARARFDLFSMGQRAFVAANTVRVPAAAVNRVARPHLTFTRRMREDGSDYSLNMNESAAGLGSVAIMSLLQEVVGLTGGLGGLGGPPGDFMEPVTVRATPAQIEANSTQIVPTEESVCSVCQDTIVTTEPARRLNFCNHTFHTRCIDTWLVQNVHCPMCRHDIRVGAPAVVAPVAPAAPAVPVVPTGTS
jgi:hypothetical protein